MDPLSAVALATNLADLGAKLWRYRKESVVSDKPSVQVEMREEFEQRLNEAVEALLKSHADLSARLSVQEQECSVLTASVIRLADENRALQKQLRLQQWFMSGLAIALVFTVSYAAFSGRLHV